MITRKHSKFYTTMSAIKSCITLQISALLTICCSLFRHVNKDSTVTTGQRGFCLYGLPKPRTASLTPLLTEMGSFVQHKKMTSGTAEETLVHDHNHG